jgi:hypothetical protein
MFPALLVGCWVAAFSLIGVPQSPECCDRSCLEGLIDRYVDALVARAPSRLPLTSTVKFTENEQRNPLS